MEALITFKNGLTLAVEQNGTCYITDTEPEFPADLSIVTVENEEDTVTFHNAKIQKCASFDKRYWFTFVERNPTDMKVDDLTTEAEINRADIDYLLMLLDEDEEPEE